MRRAQTLLILLMAAVSAGCGQEFSGASAFEFTRRAVAFGPRPSGSDANRKLQDYIRKQLDKLGCIVTEDSFTAQTPVGPKLMRNIIARFPGKSGRAIAITGHFDTKPMADFVGANDGGSSTGVLLEMARAISKRPRTDDILLVFLDGEEAFVNWSEADSLYGSRHLAERWRNEGLLARVRALINVDMIGDKDLGVLIESGSSTQLQRLVWQTARELGYGGHFLADGEAIDDDHMPFVRAGVNAIDLIDFDYGPGNAFWHTRQDTLDKLSASSLEVIGKVVLEVVRRLQI